MKFALRVGVSAAILAILAVFLPWSDVWQAATRMSGGVWLTVLLAFMVGHALNALKWRVLVNAGRPTLSRVQAIRFHYAGLFANMWLPGIVGGDVIRAVMASRTSTRLEAIVLGALADRVIDTLSVGLMLSAGAFMVRGILPGWGAQGVTIGLFGGACIAAIVVPLALRRPIRRWPPRLRRPVGRGLVALRRLASRPGTAFGALGISLAVQGGFVMLNAWIGSAIGVVVPLGAWFLAWSLAKLAGLIPISLGGLGVRDATLAGLLVPFGVPVAIGVVASLIWQSVLITGGLVGGVIWWGLGRMPGGTPQPGERVASPVSTVRA